MHLPICLFHRNHVGARRCDIFKRLMHRSEGGPSVIRWLLCWDQFAWVLLCHHLAVIAAHLRERWERFQCYRLLFVFAVKHSRHSSALCLFHRVSVTTAPLPVWLNMWLGLLARLQAPATPLILLLIPYFLKQIDSLAYPLLKMFHWVFWDELSRTILSNFFFEHCKFSSVIMSWKLLL